MGPGNVESPASDAGASPPRLLPSDLGLTERQAQILILLMQGKSNKLICRELDLAESTVKNHVTHVLKTLNVTSRTQAVIAAARMGLVLERVASSTKSRRGGNSSAGRLNGGLRIACESRYEQLREQRTQLHRRYRLVQHR